jgi:hypothetical protein
MPSESVFYPSEVDLGLDGEFEMEYTAVEVTFTPL